MVYKCQKCGKQMIYKEVGSHLGEFCHKCVYGYEFFGRLNETHIAGFSDKY